MINTESNLVYCYFGNGIALGAYGHKGAISQSLNALYNYGAHNDKINFMSENFGYVLTTKDKLKHGISNIIFQTELVPDAFTEERGHARAAKLKYGREQANSEAAAYVAEIPLENFLSQDTVEINEYAIPFK